ncbi:MAG: hypothetical protein ABR909_08440 [Candidatus Bathyarchaeia archaeon]
MSNHKRDIMTNQASNQLNLRQPCIEKSIANYQATNPKVSVKATVLDTVEPFEVNKALPLVHVLSSSVRKVLNMLATLLRKTGTYYMNILGKAVNLPVVTYGTGDSHLDHALDDHIEVSEYLNAIAVYKERRFLD